MLKCVYPEGVGYPSLEVRAGDLTVVVIETGTTGRRMKTKDWKSSAGERRRGETRACLMFRGRRAATEPVQGDQG